MVVKFRACMVLGVLGVCLPLTSAQAQGTKAAQRPQDSAVRRTSGTQPAATTSTAQPATTPPLVGTVDIKAVFNGYDKVKFAQEEFKAAAMSKRNELLKLQTEAQEEAQKLSKMTPNSIDAKKIEDRLTQIKAQMEAGRENAQREFALRESEMLATLYKEIQTMVARLAVHKKLTYVVQVNNEPISGSNPESVMAAMAQTIVYASPENDMTKDIIALLNRDYKAAGGTVPKTTTPAANANPTGN